MYSPSYFVYKTIPDQITDPLNFEIGDSIRIVLSNLEKTNNFTIYIQYTMTLEKSGFFPFLNAIW